MSIYVPYLQHLLHTKIDDHALIMNTGNGLLGLLNPTAAFVWNRRRAGRELDAIAAELASTFEQPLECVQKDVRGLLAQWDQAGLLTCADERLATVSGAWPRPEDAPRVNTVVQLNTAAVCIKSWLPTGTDALLARLQHRMQPDGNADRVVEIYPVGAMGMAFVVDGLQCGSSPDTDQGAGHLYEILLAADCRAPVLAFLHAACLQWHGSGLLLAAESWSGKTSLAAALVLAGAEYLGDELAAVVANTWQLCALPSCMSVKPSGHAWMEQLTGQLHTGPADAFWNLDVANFGFCTEQAGPPTVLVFPRYVRHETALRFERIPALEALKLLLRFGLSFGMGAGRPDLAQLVDWVQQTPAYALVYSTTEDALQAIEASLASGSVTPAPGKGGRHA